MNKFLPRLIEDEKKNFYLSVIDTPYGVLYDASEVCKKLGYTNITSELKHVPEEYKLRFRHILTTRGTPKVYLNRFGLELMVIRCRKKVVWPYQKWIIEEVLESVYKNGGYVMNQENLPAEEKEKLLEKVRQLAEENNLLKVENQNARKANGILAEKLANKEDAIYEMYKDIKHDKELLLASMNEKPNTDNLF